MEAIILEPKNKEELEAVKKTIKRMGIKSYSISNKNKKQLAELKSSDVETKELNSKEITNKANKKERLKSARHKLSTLSKRNPKATASMKLINEVLDGLRKSKK